MNLMTKLKTMFLYPFSGIQKEIRDIQHHDRAVRESNRKRVSEIMATLNGEEGWMLQGDKKE